MNLIEKQIRPEIINGALAQIMMAGAADVSFLVKKVSLLLMSLLLFFLRFPATLMYFDSRNHLILASFVLRFFVLHVAALLDVQEMLRYFLLLSNPVCLSFGILLGLSVLIALSAEVFGVAPFIVVG